DTSVAASATFALGLLRDSLAAPVLAPLLQPDSARRKPTLAIEAAEALGRIGTAEASAALTGFLENADIRDGGLQRVAGSVLIGASRTDSVPPVAIARWAASESAETRWKAAFSLIGTARPEAVGVLMPLLEDADPLVRANAIRGLSASVVAASGVTSDFVLRYLTEAMADPSYAPRIEAIRMVGSYREPTAVSLLTPVLDSDRPHDVVVAAEALGRMGAVAAPSLSALHRVAGDPARPPFVRATAIRSSFTLDRDASRDLLVGLMDDDSWRVREAVVEGLARFRVDALTELERMARDPDPRVAGAAMEAIIVSLGPNEIGRARPLLVELLQAPDPRVRVPVLQGYAWLADPSTYPGLLDAFELALRDPEPDAAIATIEAIAELGRAGMVTPERAFFARFPDPPDREIHRRAVVRFGDAAISAWGEV